MKRKLLGTEAEAEAAKSEVACDGGCEVARESGGGNDDEAPHYMSLIYMGLDVTGNGSRGYEGAGGALGLDFTKKKREGSVEEVTLRVGGAAARGSCAR